MRSPLWSDNWPLSQLFGVNPERYVQFGLAGHNGLDVAMPLGVELYAPAACVVAERGHDPTGYGLYLKLTTSDGQDFLLAHLSSQYNTAEGDNLVPGTPIAKSGNTGNSTGPHLHFGWRLLNAPFYRGWPFNGYLDPRQLLDRLQGGMWPPAPDGSVVVEAAPLLKPRAPSRPSPHPAQG